MRIQAQRFLSISSLSVLIVMAIAADIVHAQETVDVYIITGQSNAANFAQRAGTGGTDVGYNLTFARDRTVFTDPTHTDQAFSSNSLNPAQAVTILSQGLLPTNNQAILGFARNGTALSNLEPVNWFPGTDPANGQINDANFYGDFIDWTDARISEIEATGNTAIVKGLFWFQGERDAVQGVDSVNAYETNYENLAYRLRDHFGSNVPIVAAEIREGVSSNAALRATVNAGLNNVAAGDPRMTVVPTADLSWVSANDVHLNTAGYQALAPIWATEMNSLQSAAKTVLQYDSVANGDGTSTLRTLDSLTVSDSITSADTFVAFGGNTTDFGQHASQEHTVSLGSGTDKFIRFGGEAEMLSGSLGDAVLDDGEWIGASFVAEENLLVDSFSFEMFVNSANGSSWAARDAGLFLRIGDTGEFTQFDTGYEGNSGDNGTVLFDDQFSVNAGEELEWRLAFTDRTNVSVNLPATLTTRVGSIRLNTIGVEPIPGDFDNDGDVDIDDVDLLSANIGQPASANLAMDLNNDGNITLADHDQHIETLLADANGIGALIGDLNLDGDVDVSQFDPVTFTNVGDASRLLSSLGQTSGQSYGDGDLNGDGDVDVSQFDPVTFTNVGDASRLLATLGSNTAGANSASAAVPEPSSTMVFAILGIAAAGGRRKVRRI